MTELTKYGGTTNVQIPPDSSGSRISHYSHWFIKVVGASAVIDVQDDSTFFSCSVSGIYGTVHGSEVFEDGYRLLLILNESSPRTGFDLNETVTVTTASSTITSTLKTWSEVLINSAAITDAKNPAHSLAIDQVGSASVRFNEGQPQFDAFGLLRTSSVSRIADYSFRYDSLSTLFQSLSSGVGSVLTFLPNERTIALDIGTGATDRLSYTSNNYHPYTPGLGQLTVMTVSVGDTGKTNVVRRWGYFQEQNGLYFELDGPNLYLVVRSSTSGTVVNTRIPQAQWSNDVLNGAGGPNNISRMSLDITKTNIFWINFAWMGAGKVSFGVYSPSGERILCHVIENGNTISNPFMGSPELPVRVEQLNTGVSASPSRLKLTCASVLSEGEVDDDYLRIHSRYTSWVSSQTVTVTDTAQTLIVAVRAAELFKGLPNRRKIIPQKLNYFVQGNPIELNMQLGIDMIVSGGTWAQCHPQASAEYNNTATLLANGDLLSSVFLPVGATSLDASPDFNSRNSFMSRLADGSSGVLVMFTAKCLTPGQTATVKLSVDWTEL